MPVVAALPKIKKKTGVSHLECIPFRSSVQSKFLGKINNDLCPWFHFFVYCPLDKFGM